MRTKPFKFSIEEVIHYFTRIDYSVHDEVYTELQFLRSGKERKKETKVGKIHLI